MFCPKISSDYKWQWNTPHAGHKNGGVEIFIKSVGRDLNATRKNKAFTEEQWRTILSEIEYVINGCP